MNQLSTSIAIVAFSAIVSTACTDDSDNTGDAGRGGDSGIGADSGPSAGEGGDDDGDASAGSDGGDAGVALDGGTDGSSDAAANLTNPQIAAVTSAANTGEIMQAQTALPKLSNAEAKAFAMSMIDMHTAAQERQAALLQRKQIMPEDNPTSTALKQESDAIVAALMAASAPDVDQLYIEKQVDVHTKVLALLDDELIPSAEDAELRAELMTARDEVAAHLNQAEQVKASISP